MRNDYSSMEFVNFALYVRNGKLLNSWHLSLAPGEMLESQREDAWHCHAHPCRSTTIGSSRDARRAGPYAAPSATASSSAIATASVSGSWGATP